MRISKSETYKQFLISCVCRVSGSHTQKRDPDRITLEHPAGRTVTSDVAP